MAEESQAQLIDYIRVIQSKSRFILTGTFIAILIAIAYFWGYCKPIYEAKVILLNIEPRFQKFGTDVTSNALTMVSLKDLVESQDLIAEVRKQMGWEKTIKLDDLIKFMEVKLVIEEDTNLHKIYSPVLELYAEANSGPDAAKLANTWATLFIQRYNALTQKVSAQTYQFIQSEYEITESQLKSKQAEFSKMKQQLANSKKQLSSTRGLLTGYLASPGTIDNDLQKLSVMDMLHQSSAFGERDGPQNSNKTFMTMDAPQSTGLLDSSHLIGYEGQLHDIQLKIKDLEAKQKAGATVKTELAGSQAQEKELKSKIVNLRKEMGSLENTISQQETQLASLDRSMVILQSKFILLAKRKEEADIEKSRLENTLKSGIAESDDIKVASWAVPPEKKIGPKRVLGTLGVGIAAFLLFTLIAFLQNYMTMMARSSSKI